MNGANGHFHVLEPTLFDDDEDSDFPVARERLEKFVPRTSPPEEVPVGPTRTESNDPLGKRGDPGLVAILDALGNHNVLHEAPVIQFADSRVRSCDTVMTDHGDGAEATEKAGLSREAQSLLPVDTHFETRLKNVANHGIDASIDHNDLQATAKASLQQHAAAAENEDIEQEDNGLEKRHDSHQEEEGMPVPSDNKQQETINAALSKLQPDNVPNLEGSFATSPTLSRHLKTESDDPTAKLPDFQSQSDAAEINAGSSQGAALPSIHQIVPARTPRGPLNEFAEICSQNDARTASQGSPPLTSIMTHSPGIPYHPYHGSTQLSPTGAAALSLRSPAAPPHNPYGSPVQFATLAHYVSRRSSAPTSQPPTLPPSIPSVSSSGESYGHASSVDEYSTSHTTPVDPGELNVGRTLPPVPGMPAPAQFKCDAPDCTAAPFQTQYLLSSHQNVHTNARPYFCNVEGCSRAKGGQGFKRKNEMIRHGLVHQSPGYVCPFCPDREHRYPRPDNLQRHVKAHHKEKDKNDPELAAVLAQRSQGVGKTRRRRANTGGSAS